MANSLDRLSSLRMFISINGLIKQPGLNSDLPIPGTMRGYFQNFCIGGAYRRVWWEEQVTGELIL